MALTPSTLFHFTSKVGLKGILKENFKLKYCREKVLMEDEFSIGVPMVSFCDIKISELKEHIGKYGNYGIGLSKIWAIKQGLNPVIYLNKESHYTKSLIKNIFDFIKDDKIDYDKSYTMIDTLRYIKSYEGLLVRVEDEIENYRFADEREWRYVPQLSSIKKCDDYLLEYEINDETISAKKNRILGKVKLHFDVNDILYLIVKEEKEIEEIIKYIRSVKSIKYSLQEVERLMTRIISCERIFNDF
jgi:hypothetical protein